MNDKEIIIKFYKLNKEAIIPSFQSEEAAGFDFHAIEDTLLKSGSHGLIKTGLCIELQKGYELQIRPRSGLALKHKITILNSPGTVDSDYRGELQMILINFGVDYIIKKGDRIAQGVIHKLPNVIIKETFEVNKTKRGENGFGSTGK